MAKMTLDDLVGQLQKAYAAELHAVVLYGSAARGGGDHVARKSDYNVLVIVDALDADRLQAASAAVRAWTDSGNPPPLLLTNGEWLGSADIFPMEYADIFSSHKVLHGSLPGDITVDPAHLRLELEHEAMGTLLQLRRGLLASGNDSKEQLSLLEASASTVMVIFRAFIRLAGEEAEQENAGLVQQAAARAGFDAAPFLAAIRHKRGEEAIRAADAPRILAGYLAGMQRLVTHLDEMG